MLTKRIIMSAHSYGRVEMRLAQVMEEKGITRNALARHIGTRFEVIDRWCDGNMEKLDLDILARICYVLECSISDILVLKSK